MKRVVWEPLPDGFTHNNPNWAIENEIRLCRATEVDEPAPPDVPAQMAELEAENERLRGRITELLVPPAPALAQPDVPQEEAGYLGTVDWKGWKVDLYQDDGDDD